MKCKYYLKLIHLNRPDELTPRQARRLDQHLQNCAQCAAIKQSIDCTSIFIRHLREITPEHPAPQQSAHEIVNTVKMLNGAKSARTHLSLSNTILDWFAIPKVRLATASLIILFIGTFFFQELFILYRIAHLENKVAVYSQGTKNLKAVRITQANLLSELKKINKSDIPSEITSLQDKFADDWILIEKNKLASLLISQKKLQHTNQLLLKSLEELAATATDFSLEDGISRAELELLFERKELIIKTLRQL